jgi:hypothetical protein
MIGFLLRSEAIFAGPHEVSLTFSRAREDGIARAGTHRGEATSSSSYNTPPTTA